MFMNFRTRGHSGSFKGQFKKLLLGCQIEFFFFFQTFFVKLNPKQPTTTFFYESFIKSINGFLVIIPME